MTHARYLADQIATGSIPAAQVLETRKLIFNDWPHAAVTVVFATLVILILIESWRNWWL